LERDTRLPERRRLHGLLLSPKQKDQALSFAQSGALPDPQFRRKLFPYPGRPLPQKGLPPGRGQDVQPLAELFLLPALPQKGVQRRKRFCRRIRRRGAKLPIQRLQRLPGAFVGQMQQHLLNGCRPDDP
jgi:hypothetical protein